MEVGLGWVDPGTLVRNRSEPPLPAGSGLTPARHAFAIPADVPSKLLYAAKAGLPSLPAEMRAQLEQCLSIEAMVVLAGSVGLLAAAHALAIGFVVDVAFLGVTVAIVGRDTLEAARSFERFYRFALRAEDEAELARAGEEFARAVTIVGINVFIMFFAIRTRKTSGMAARSARNVEALKAAWIKIADGVDFQVPRDRGMLWTQLNNPGIWAGALSENNAAISVAREKGLVALESILKEQGVLERYLRIFGETYEDAKRAGLKPVADAFWDRISRRYASALQGKVTAYVHGPSLLAALKSGRRPILYKELGIVTEIMNETGRVSEIEVIEVKSGTRHVIRRGLDH